MSTTKLIAICSIILASLTGCMPDSTRFQEKQNTPARFKVESATVEGGWPYITIITDSKTGRQWILVTRPTNASLSPLPSEANK